jgi:hypothetical protein
VKGRSSAKDASDKGVLVTSISDSNRVVRPSARGSDINIVTAVMLIRH